jgi:hypothetical protein
MDPVLDPEVVASLASVGDVNNILNGNNLADNGDSGGMSRWLLWTIILSAVAIVVTGAVFLVRYIIRKRRESNQIISDVVGSISGEIDQKTVDVIVNAALKSAATSAHSSTSSCTKRCMDSSAFGLWLAPALRVRSKRVS